MKKLTNKALLNKYVFRGVIAIPLFFVLLVEVSVNKISELSPYLYNIRNCILNYADRNFPIK